jgi:hypothetical protein
LYVTRGRKNLGRDTRIPTGGSVNTRTIAILALILIIIVILIWVL